MENLRVLNKKGLICKDPESFSLLQATDEGNLNEIIELIDNNSFSEDVLEYCFVLAVLHRYLPVIQYFLTKDRLLSREFIDDIFFHEFFIGKYPEVILLFQEHCSSRKLAEAFRFFQKNSKKTTHYLVNPIELEKYNKEVKPLLSKKKPRKSIDYLRLLCQLNNALLDACFCNNRYIVKQFLYRGHPHSPSQITIDSLLYHTVAAGNYTLAEIICEDHPDYRRVHQQGINDAFLLCVQEEYLGAVEWLLYNTANIRPSIDFIVQGYRELMITNFHETELLQFDFRKILAPQRWKAYYSSQIRKIMEEKRQELEERTRIIALIKPYITDEEFLAAVDTEIRRLTDRAAARRRIANGTFGGHFLEAEIHSYSGSLVNDPERQEGNTSDLMGQIDPVEAIAQQLNNNNNNNDDDDDGQEMEEGGENIEGNEENVPVPVPRGRMDIHGRRTVQNVVKDHLEKRVEAFYRDMTQDDVLLELDRLIHTYLPSTQHEAAIHRLGEILNQHSLRNFSITLQFLHNFHPDSLGIWINGFMGEVIAVHSCTPGAMERIVTGLRGINDPELNRIFGSVEGKQLFRIFLTTMNVFHPNQERRAANIRNIVEVLITPENILQEQPVISMDPQEPMEIEGQEMKREENVRYEIAPFPTEQILQTRLEEYVREQKRSYFVPENEMGADVEGVVIVIMDSMDDLLPSLRERYDKLVQEYRQQRRGEGPSRRIDRNERGGLAAAGEQKMMDC